MSVPIFWCIQRKSDVCQENKSKWSNFENLSVLVAHVAKQINTKSSHYAHMEGIFFWTKSRRSWGRQIHQSQGKDMRLGIMSQW